MEPPSITLPVSIFAWQGSMRQVPYRLLPFRGQLYLESQLRVLLISTKPFLDPHGRASTEREKCWHWTASKWDSNAVGWNSELDISCPEPYSKSMMFVEHVLLRWRERTWLWKGCSQKSHMEKSLAFYW